MEKLNFYVADIEYVRHLQKSEYEYVFRVIALQHSDKLWTQVSEYAKTCSWRAGKNLSQMMDDNAFSDYERVFVALEKGNIAGYCTLLKSDCIPDVEYTPYIGFVFVGEDYRGNRISEKLCRFAMQYAESVGFDKVYLVSGEVNLYEKYGFVKIDEKLSNWGAVQNIYVFEDSPANAF